VAAEAVEADNRWLREWLTSLRQRQQQETGVAPPAVNAAVVASVQASAADGPGAALRTGTASCTGLASALRG